MSDFRKLTESFYASPQIAAEDLAEARNLGMTLLVNNRPDGEEDGQPTGAEIEAAARVAGMDYVAIPVTSAGFSENQLGALDEAIAESDGPVLAYCRSGTRSTLLWSLSQARRGSDPETIAATARAAGYDISPIRPAIDAFAARARKPD
ncbi:MAG: TIGR01244 family phosphatase [Citromicrobium sp.]|nr:MAG: TIGR01244 family phosphatase [Citromicrobium sp.]